MKALSNSLITLAIWGTLSACSNPQQIHTAPLNQEEANSRFIIQGSKADTAAVLSQSESYRVLSQKQGVYEVKGLNYFEIKAIAPSVSAEQNQYFETQSFKKVENPYQAYLMDSE